MLRVQHGVNTLSGSQTTGAPLCPPAEYDISDLCFFQTIVPDLVAISGTGSASNARSAGSSHLSTQGTFIKTLQ